MAHIFDILTTVCRQIDDFAKKRQGVPNVPDFLVVEANRAIDTIDTIRIDETKPITIEKCFRSHAGNPEILIYSGIADNISEPVIDTFAIITDGKDRKDKDIEVCDTAIGVLLPKILFEEDTDIVDVTKLLNKIYLAILDTDINMKYSAEPAILRLAKSNKIRIPTYDIEMMICALCCSYISLSSWFAPAEGETMIETSYVLDSFEEIPEDIKEKLSTIMTRHCASTKSLKDSIGTGKLLKIFFS